MNFFVPLGRSWTRWWRITSVADKQDHKVAQEQSQKDKQQSLFDDMKTWETKNISLDGVDTLKVDISSINEQAGHPVFQSELIYHEM